MFRALSGTGMNFARVSGTGHAVRRARVYFPFPSPPFLVFFVSFNRQEISRPSPSLSPSPLRAASHARLFTDPWLPCENIEVRL